MNWCLLLLNIYVCIYFPFFSFVYSFFNWRIITLQYCDFLPCVNMNQPQMYTCPRSRLNPFLTSLPTHPSRLSWSIGFGFLASYITLPLAIHFIYGNAYVSMLFSQIIPPPSLTVSKSLFFMSVSFTTLHAGSLVPSFQIPYKWVNI